MTKKLHVLRLLTKFPGSFSPQRRYSLFFCCQRKRGNKHRKYRGIYAIVSSAEMGVGTGVLLCNAHTVFVWRKFLVNAAF